MEKDNFNLDEVAAAAIAKIESQQSTETVDDLKEQETTVVGNDMFMRSLQNNTGNLPIQETPVEQPHENIPPVQSENNADKRATEKELGLIPEDAPIPETDQTSEAPKQYTGPGLVINHEELDALKAEDEKQQGLKFTGVLPSTQEAFDAYIADMDAEIAQHEKIVKQIEEEHNVKFVPKEEREHPDQLSIKLNEEPFDDDEEDEEDDTNNKTPDEFKREYEEAVVLIDKTGFGSIDFTEEEHAKLERAKTIRLEEIQTVELKTIKTKKKKKNISIDKVIERVTSPIHSNIVLPISGYIAVMKGCSAHELLSLVKANDTGNNQVNIQTRWSLVYDKIVSTSLDKDGKKISFNDFLLNTASVEIPIFIYGILCATYPNDDSMPLSCPKCGKNFDHPYTIKSLIRAEQMSDKLKELVANAVDNSYSENTAWEYHNSAPISMSKAVQLPETGIIADFCIQTAYKLLNKSSVDLQRAETEPKYEESVILATAIDKFYIPDEDSDEYTEVDDSMDIAKVIYALPETDSKIVTQLVNDTLEDIVIDFGLMEVTCPSCKNYTPSVPVDPDTILFYRYQQAMSTKVE